MKLLRSRRPLILGKNGAVASNHPVATAAGLQVLQAGGNAADAAVAMALTLGVVEPHMSGLGGDGFYQFHDGLSGRGRVYNGSGMAPAATSTSSSWPDGMALQGAGSVSVPGAVGALYRLHECHGQRPWSSLFSPSIEAARHGFGVTDAFRRFAINNVEKLRREPLTSRLFLRHGAPPEGGDYLVQGELSDSLEELAEGGAESFYRGRLARRLMADFQESGVPISASDLASYHCEEQEPLSVDYRGFTVRQTPPNSMGFTLLQELQILRNFDLAGLGYLSANTLHLMIEAKKLAFADRERYATDPRTRSIPMDMLLSDEHARTLAALISSEQAAELPISQLAVSGSDTTYFCVIDADGSAVSGIQSLNNAFGSGVTAPSTGVLLNNRMACWHLQDDHPNRMAAGKRVRHTMNAPIVLRDGKVWALFGTPGADDQVQVNMQVAVGLIDFDIDPQHVVESPRWSSDQVGQEANWPHGGGDLLTVEADMPPATLDGLRALGHKLRVVPPLEGPCSVACIRVLENGAYAVGSDPRRDGWGAAF